MRRHNDMTFLGFHDFHIYTIIELGDRTWWVGGWSDLVGSVGGWVVRKVKKVDDARAPFFSAKGSSSKFFAIFFSRLTNFLERRPKGDEK